MQLPSRHHRGQVRGAGGQVFSFLLELRDKLLIIKSQVDKYGEKLIDALVKEEMDPKKVPRKKI